MTEGFGYDANRMQLTSQTATKSGGPANGLMNLTYGYDATAGQMGAGSAAGNAGQLMSISGTINSTTESATYSYDDLGRLVTSNQTSNGSSAQRRFVYDRWGNRTGMWDAVSGGTQIQSITLQQSGGAATNKIQSVTSGSTVNYSYDNAGNVTNDGAHSYTYDAENRIVNVDGGSTATYAYDQSNQRYKKVIGGTTTHYIWQDSQVIAEHNGGTGASTADYVYSGSRMIAKVAGLTTQYFLSDRLSERLMLNTSGTVIGRQGHLPFGEDFGESGNQEKHHFTGYERDSETGADYAMNRQSSQNIGRFMRPDSFSGSYDYKTPQTLNRYVYTVSDPVNQLDPSGLEIIVVCDPSGKDCYRYGIVPTDPFGVGIAPVLPADPPDRCPADKRRFFNWLADPLAKMAQDLNTTLTLLLTLAAKEGGWTNKDLNHNQPLFNPFGVNHTKHKRAVGNKGYDSLDEGIQDWEGLFGDRVRGVQTADDFAYGLEHPDHGRPYNTDNPNWENEYQDLFDDVVKYMKLCGIQ